MKYTFVGPPVVPCLAIHIKFVLCRSGSVPSPHCVCHRNSIGMSDKDSSPSFAFMFSCALVQVLLYRELLPCISPVFHALAQEFKLDKHVWIFPFSPVLLWLATMSIFMHLHLLFALAVRLCMHGLHCQIIRGCGGNQHHFHRPLPTSNWSECASDPSQLNRLLQGRRAAAGSWPRNHLRSTMVGCVRWWMLAKPMSCNTGTR
mmetsp:Transcript_7101/g.43946  ORF Transcript_7101/g.43946 Transcript_7101/m.43946 type:complete len:203 (+) Transcript_7101:1143-1751(+)